MMGIYINMELGKSPAACALKPLNEYPSLHMDANATDCPMLTVCTSPMPIDLRAAGRSVP
jgi:hypothetical protein